MLFNSYAFLFGFLPITLCGYFLLARRSIRAASAWLAAASLAFYGYWDFHYVPLLVASIIFNYVVGRQISNAGGGPIVGKLLLFGVVSNLALLGYFKYADFFVESLTTLGAVEAQPLGIILPLGISFFTFTQIAYLADARAGKASEYAFTNYVLFVTYFPHLIAGPILHHREMMPQFASATTYVLRASNFAVGTTIFVIGLAKKVLIADNLALYANDLFASPDEPSLFIAWSGVLAYTFQLYFDFSGYSDMAIGLSRLFGVRLPLNFNSPYKASSISEFWRCWHMTLSRFLRDYLYIALGGNKRGSARRYANLMITMLLGGLWHGAGWTYVVWGGLHGTYLVINHAWERFRIAVGYTNPGRVWHVFATAITFFAVAFAWVFFRASSLDSAATIVAGLSGLHGAALPQSLLSAIGLESDGLAAVGISSYLGGGQRFIESCGWTGFAALIAFLAPNAQQIVSRFDPALDFRTSDGSAPILPLAWQPTLSWAIVVGTLASLCILSLSRPTEFLYFQF